MAALNPVLQVERLTKSFGVLVLFRDISFGLAEGQKVGLIAKNGTGKSTLLSILAGEEPYDEGKITFRRDLRVGYLPQTPHYPSQLTVLEACLQHGSCQLDPHKDYELAAKQMLTKLKVADLQQPVSELSGGQLKRVALVNALINDPELLILDDCTSALDANTEQKIQETLARILVGKTAIMVSQRVSMAMRCHKIAVLENGVISEYGTHHELLEKHGFYAKLFSQQTE